jgi:hypothetical protein
MGQMRSLIKLAIPLMLIALIILPGLAKALIRETSIGYAQLDKEKKCDNINTNAISSCFNLGVKGGMIDGTQEKNTNLGFSVVGGCGAVESPNYCAGYIKGYSQPYGHFPSATEYADIVKKAAISKAQAYGVSPPSKIICNASPTFCSIYQSAYKKEFPTNAPYYAGHDAGEQYANHVLDTCHETKHLHIPSGHSKAWQTGYSQGYADTISEAQNDDGTYGSHRCHF